MSRSRGPIIAAALVSALIVCGCTGSKAASSASPASAGASTAPSVAAGSPDASAAAGTVDCVQGSVTAVGSTALQPLVDQAGKNYGTACPGAVINVQGGGSGIGLTQVFQGSADIGDSDITAQEKLDPTSAAQLVDHAVVQQGFIMVVNRGVIGVTNVSTQQAIDIWTGKITNWKDLGGPDQAIVLILRPQSSGTRATFKRIVLGGRNEAVGQALTEDSSGAVATAVSVTPGSISVIGFAYYKDNKEKLSGLALDGVEANVDNMTNGSYKVTAPGHMFTKGQPQGLTKAFLDYMMSPAVQQVLGPSMNYAPAPSPVGS